MIQSISIRTFNNKKNKLKMNHKKQLLEDYLQTDIQRIERELKEKNYTLVRVASPNDPNDPNEKVDGNFIFKALIQSRESKENSKKKDYLVEVKGNDAFFAKNKFVERLKEVLKQIKENETFKPFNKALEKSFFKKGSLDFVPSYY